MSEISDGYGDDLTNDEVVARFRKWSYRVAQDFVSPSSQHDIDDLAQESMIAMWRALEKKGGKANVSATYLVIAGRARMKDLSTSSRPPTGGDPTPGPKSRPETNPVDWQSVASGEEGHEFDHLLEASDLLSAVDWAYHHGEILACLNALDLRDRLYVHARFWEGKTDTEIAAETGESNKNLGQRWKRSIRPRLAEGLSRLVVSGHDW